MGSQVDGTAGSRIESIERIDMASDTGTNTLKLELKDVLDMSGMNNFNLGNGWSNITGTALTTSVARHQVAAMGTALDKVDIGTKVAGSNVSDGVNTYDAWNHNTSAAQLLMQENMAVLYS